MIKNIEIDQLSGMVPEMLAAVKSGADVVLSDHNRPVARVVPEREARKAMRTPGLHAGMDFFMADDFDAPLPQDFWTGNIE